MILSTLFTWLGKGVFQIQNIYRLKIISSKSYCSCHRRVQICKSYVQQFRITLQSLCQQIR